MAQPKIAIIDISSFLKSPDDASDVIRQWDDAFRTAGFCIVVGHGVDCAVIDELLHRTTEFFAQPLEAKMASYLQRGYGQGGYVPVGVEAVARSQGVDAPPDAVETFIFKSEGTPEEYPNIMPELGTAIINYRRHIIQLRDTLLRLSCAALSLDDDVLLIPHNPGRNTLKLSHYPAVEALPADAPLCSSETSHASATMASASQTRYGAHTDYTGFTILYTTGPGLEVEIEGQWVPIPVVDGGFVINAGDLIQRWTNDIWRSNLHRVVASDPPTPARISMVIFTGPSDGVIVTPLPTCVNVDRPARYEAVEARQYLTQKVQSTSV